MGSQRLPSCLALQSSTMAAFVNLLVMLFALTLMTRVDSIGRIKRGCRCYVKDSPTGSPLGDTWYDVGGFLAGCNDKRREKCRNKCKDWVKGLAETNKDSPIFHTYSGDRTIYSKLDCDKASSFSSDRWMKDHLPKHCLDDVCWNKPKRSREPSSSRTNSGSGGFDAFQYGGHPAYQK